MNVSVCIPTRGDVDLSQVFASYDGIADEVLIWDNSKRENLAVYGRYAMITEAHNDLVMTQDDDVLHSPDGIREMIRAWFEAAEHPDNPHGDKFVLCNMPERFRHSFYADHALVGFGAVFHRDIPFKAFAKLWNWQVERQKERGFDLAQMATGSSTVMQKAWAGAENPKNWPENFLETCDIVFTALTPRVLVDVAYADLPWASAPDRMWKQPEHVAERQRMRELVKQVRDATKANT